MTSPISWPIKCLLLNIKGNAIDIYINIQCSVSKKSSDIDSSKQCCYFPELRSNLLTIRMCIWQPGCHMTSVSFLIRNETYWCKFIVSLSYTSKQIHQVISYPQSHCLYRHRVQALQFTMTTWVIRSHTWELHYTTHYKSASLQPIKYLFLMFVHAGPIQEP